MNKPDPTGRRAAFVALAAGVLCVMPPVLVLLFGAGVLVFLPSWLDFVLVPLFVILGPFALYRWWRWRAAAQAPG